MNNLFDNEKEQQPDENLANEEKSEDNSSVSTETAENEIDSESSAVSEETADEVDPHQQEIDNLKEEVKSQEDKYLKLYAEFENFKRRNKQEIDLNNKYKEQKFTEDLLPVIDNLERAMDIEGETEAFASLKKGVEMVYNDFLNIFSKHDITVIESTGKEFDPNVHQAVMTEPSKEGSGVVIEEFQKGYMLKDRVIRPSMVKVSE
ncbi:nucleotide exchange factor GrpE [Lacicoccus qingdaonensis]|uniref:nucleotide exchange factor GrpE n=1 Tax=Lacicoccus qingdaonensis TaxID=576118 RepID=UPI0038B38B78